MIEAEDALRAVGDLVQETVQGGGYIEELLSIGDGGFLIMYATNDGVLRFAAEGCSATLIEVAEYDLAKDSSTDITAMVPDLMELVNAVY